MTNEELNKEMERLEINIKGGDLAAGGAMLGHIVNLYYLDGNQYDPATLEEIQSIIDGWREASDNAIAEGAQIDTTSENYEFGYLAALIDVVSAFKVSLKLDA